MRRAFGRTRVWGSEAEESQHQVPRDENGQASREEVAEGEGAKDRGMVSLVNYYPTLLESVDHGRFPSQLQSFKSHLAGEGSSVLFCSQDLVGRFVFSLLSLEMFQPNKPGTAQ